MKPIRSLDQLAEHVQSSCTKKKIAVAAAEDSNTFDAIVKATENGIVEAVMLGSAERIRQLCEEKSFDPAKFTIIDIPDELKATQEAVRMVKAGEADILMKGLVGTDKFLKAVLDKSAGLLPAKQIMSYVCALEIPAYHKLLFISDTAVLPFPDLNQKIAMTNFSIKMAKRFGIEKPKVALIGASEKVSLTFPNSIDYAMISKMSQRHQLEEAIIDGPLDVFLACDKESVEIKGVKTAIDGDADILIFPNIEVSNAFYKGLMLFAGAELGGLIQGTEKPVVVMSRSESPKSKYYCIALACLMAEER
ncbi:MAG TPA: phosphate acyltransferase [Candidatus Cloacimonadota bacterium]|nr:phosphate acyltransferase [Candidatus Cloacimonadota bacterium]